MYAYKSRMPLDSRSQGLDPSRLYAVSCSCGGHKALQSVAGELDDNGTRTGYAYGQEEVVVSPFAPRVLVQSNPELTQELKVSSSLVVVRRVFVINIQAIQAVVLK